MKLDLNNVILETPLLRLVPLTQKYSDECFREFTPEVTTFMWPSPAKTVTDSEQYIMEATAKRVAGHEIVWAIVQGEEFMGCAGVHEVDTHTPEFGLWLKVAAQSQGYGKEVIQTLKKWTDENIDYTYIKYPVAAENARSRVLVESIGGEVVGEFDRATQDGRLLHEIEYHIFK